MILADDSKANEVGARYATALRSQLLEATQRGATFEERAKHVDDLRSVIREREKAIAHLQAEASALRERGAV